MNTIGFSATTKDFRCNKNTNVMARKNKDEAKGKTSIRPGDPIVFIKQKYLSDNTIPFNKPVLATYTKLTSYNEAGSVVPVVKTDYSPYITLNPDKEFFTPKEYLLEKHEGLKAGLSTAIKKATDLPNNKQGKVIRKILSQKRSLEAFKTSLQEKYT